jgi:hypothetical protein
METGATAVLKKGMRHDSTARDDTGGRQGVKWTDRWRLPQRYQAAWIGQRVLLMVGPQREDSSPSLDACASVP